ncbi:MAG: alpha/beta fold hydrolase [Ilumatobacteraceae bacterium]
MAQAAVNGITIEFEEYGRGDPLLLVMGLSGQLTDWPPELIEHLVAAGFRVIAPDNRDIGLSTEMSGEGLARSSVVQAMLGRPAKAPYSLSDMASDAVGVLDHLGIDRAHVVGMSMGGMISQEIAIGWPDRVLSLTSIMSHTGDRRHGLAKPSLLWRITRLGDPDPSNPSSVVDNSMKIWQWISGPTYDEAVARQRIEAGVERSIRVQGTARQTAAIFASRDRTPLLASVKCPTLVVHGMVDPLVTPSGGRTTAKAVPGARLIEFPDMGHDLPTNRIPEIVEEIRRNADRA